MITRRSFIAAMTSALSAIGLLSRKPCKAFDGSSSSMRLGEAFEPSITISEWIAFHESVEHVPRREGQTYRVIYQGYMETKSGHQDAPDYSAPGVEIIRDLVTHCTPVVAKDGGFVYRVEWLFELESATPISTSVAQFGRW